MLFKYYRSLLAFMCFLLMGLLPIMTAGRAHSQTPQPLITLTDITSETGIMFRHTTGGNGFAYIVEGVSAGVATFDYDGDGWIDIYFLNGRSLKGSPADKSLRNALYRNNGNWTFTDVTEEAGIPGTAPGLGVVAGDYDGDGDLDLYLNNFGPNNLYRNNGDRTFTDVTAEAGVSNGNKVGAGASFFDADSDGDLDLFVGNYIDFNYENHVEILRNGIRYHAGPQYYRPVPATLFRNEGNGKFTDVSVESKIASVEGPSMGLLSADFDDDGDFDIFICNDGEPNFLFKNDGNGVFEESAMLSGVGLDFDGKENSSMGVDLGDYNQDGKLDLIVTNYQAELPVLYRNAGDGTFEDSSAAARVPHSLYPHVTWGTGFVDFDQDGDRDIFIAAGHFDQVELIDDSTKFKVRNFMLENLGGKFRDITASSGSAFTQTESSRGVAFDDLDNDGDVDVVVINTNAPPSILKNESANKNHWCQIELEHPAPNTHAVGSKVFVRYANKSQRQDALAGRGYQGHFGSRMTFGIPATASPVNVTPLSADVIWPDGTKQSFDLQLDKLNKLKRQ